MNLKILSILTVLIILTGTATAYTINIFGQNIELPTLTIYDKTWSVKIYYITQNNNYDSQYISKIDNGMIKASQILQNYDGTKFNWQIEKVNLPTTAYAFNDINQMTYDTEKSVIKSIPNFKTEYDSYDITFLVFHGTTGGAYSINFKSPIWFSWSAMTTDINSLGGMGIVHEFLHPFGLIDVNGGQKGCIMGDLYISTLNLCDQAYLFIPSNYQKTPPSEWGLINVVAPIPTPAPTPTTTNPNPTITQPAPTQYQPPAPTTTIYQPNPIPTYSGQDPINATLPGFELILTLGILILCKLKRKL